MSQVSGPGHIAKPSGPATSKTSKSGRLNVGGIVAKVTNQTSSSTKSPINEAAKHTDIPSPASRQKGGTRAKHEAAARAYAQVTSPLQTGAETPSSHASQDAIESAANSKDFMEHSLGADLAGSGMLLRRRDAQETDRRRRVGDSKGGKSGEEEEEEENNGKAPVQIKNIDATKEREEEQKEEKEQHFHDRLEQLTKEGKHIDPQDIINIAWGKSGEYKDPTVAYEALLKAEKHFKKSDQEPLKNLSNSIFAAATILYKEKGPDIRKGYFFDQGFVLQYDKVLDSFKAIMDKTGGNPRLFLKETDKLTKAIQIDIKTQESTLDPIHLRQIMKDLYTVQMCSQVTSDCSMLLRDMQTLYSTPLSTNKE